MRAFHDSRDEAYRNPYGAVKPKTHVTLAIDVWDSPDARVTLRTWTAETGEALQDMAAVAAHREAPSPSHRTPAEDGSAENDDEHENRTRFQITIAPERVGIVWYSFVIAGGDGAVMTYGAKPGQTGGSGEMAMREPPSFQLSVIEDEPLPLPWHAPIADYLRHEGARDLALGPEIVETLCENYPADMMDELLPGAGGPSGIREKLAQCTRLDGDVPALPPFACDDAPCFSVNGDVFGLWWRNDAGYALCALFNSSAARGYDFSVPLVDEAVSELLNGYGVPIDGAMGPGDVVLAAGEFERYARIHLDALGSALLHFHPEKRLAKPLPAGVGVLAHITSLPSGHLGAAAFEFVDWLAQAGAKYWQVLPVNPTDSYGSPYAGLSAFAGNTDLLSNALHTDMVNEIALEHLGEYRQFCRREADWLDPYAVYMAIRRRIGEDSNWQDWPDGLRLLDPCFSAGEDARGPQTAPSDAGGQSGDTGHTPIDDAQIALSADVATLIADDPELLADAETWRRAQFVFDWEWSELRAYANRRGILIVGDMPIYVNGTSADTWMHPEIFQLDSQGLALSVAGCPPDAFAADGQVWGNPLFDWDALAESGYEWWLRRLERAFDLYDVVRLDHFIGFSRYFSIPSGEKASSGAFEPGPKTELFRRAYEKFGPLPIIAEDLGLITPAVRALAADCGFPGMDVMQFVDGNDPLSGYRPRPEKIAYTGTHDNQTLVGYCEQRYPDQDARATAEALAEAAATCGADVVVMPLQDVLLYGDEARMNTPGTTEGNWSWQAVASQIAQGQERLRRLVDLHEAAGA